jgi:DNA-binding transcriptional LysR family regulator
MDQSMDFEALANFNLVAVHGGFGRASRATARSKATLSRHVTSLEKDLGARLIERGTRTLRLTEEGRTLHERTVGLIAEITEAGEAVISGAVTPRGRLRVSAPVVFAHVVLSRFAARFAIAYPQVHLEIVAEDRLVDPVEDGYDLVIRIDPKTDDRLVGRRIMGDERLVVSAMPHPGDVPSGQSEEWSVPAVMMTSSSPGSSWRIKTDRIATITLRPTPVLRLSSLLMVRDAVLTGVGAARLPRLLVEDDVAAGRLFCWGIEDAPPVEIWALQSSHRLISAKVRAFLDALGEAFPRKQFEPGAV